MKIRLITPCLYKGDVYSFTDEFEDWMEARLDKCVEETDAFIKKYGKGWTVTFRWDTGRRIKRPKLLGPWIDRKFKEIEWEIGLPWFRHTSPDLKAYVPVLRQFLERLAIVLKHEGADASRLEKETEVLLKQFVRQSGLLEHDPHPYTFGTPENPYGLREEPVGPGKPKPKGPAKPVKKNLPKWKIPRNIRKRVAAEDGLWEDERFDPILLTVMADTSHDGREIPLAWQIEFDPFDDRLAAANGRLAASGVEPDGDGWSSDIEKEFARRHPKLAGEIHSDSESSTCVLWVESEEACRKLIELAWSLMHS